MIHLTALSGTPPEPAFRSHKSLIRIGRSAGCDLRIDGQRHPQVSHHHAEISLMDGHHVLVDAESEHGTMVNGRRITRHVLEPGDRILFGGPGGPEYRFDPEDRATSAAPPRPAGSTPPPAGGEVEVEARRIASALSATNDTVMLKVVNAASLKLAEHRARAGGASSGKTLFIMAETLNLLQRRTLARSGRRWGRVVVAVTGVALVGMVILGVIIHRQRQQIAALLEEKSSLDKRIAEIQRQMRDEQDPARLEALEAMLETWSGDARMALEKIGRTDRKKAAELAESGDELDRDLRRILSKFGAETYAVPPIFKEQVQKEMDALVHSGRLKELYRRKKLYWPYIAETFNKRNLPEEIAYIAWVESGFSPDTESPVHAVGMWQFMDATARQFQLRVDDKVDQRRDWRLATGAAAQYVTKLLYDFGGESFMLSIAGYNCGENKLHWALDQVARESGGFNRQLRDFWYLYRVKKMPEETRRYVPRVLAAAIVGSHPERYGFDR